jgi:Txe/YoeB family toxin of Txe-Axe toxin-antitoxin module
MPRIRSIHPNFFEDGDIKLLSPWTIIYFPYLWCRADKNGILKDRPSELRPKILPSNINAEICLRELASPKKESPRHPPFILRYEADGEKYIKILKWKDYQNPHPHEKDSKFPEPLDDTKYPDPAYDEPEQPEESEQPEEADVDPVPRQLVEFMCQKISEKNPKFKKPKGKKLATWIKDMNLILKTDNEPQQDIRAVIEWAQSDDFWRGNIMSPEKLREQFGQLWSKMHVKKAGEKTQEELDREDEEALKDPGR